MFDLKEIAAALEAAAGKLRGSLVVPMPSVLNGYVDKKYGLVVALRAGGDEILFIPRELDPARWVPIGEFRAEPQAIFTRQELLISKGVE